MPNATVPGCDRVCDAPACLTAFTSFNKDAYSSDPTKNRLTPHGVDVLKREKVLQPTSVVQPRKPPVLEPARLAAAGKPALKSNAADSKSQQWTWGPKDKIPSPKDVDLVNLCSYPFHYWFAPVPLMLWGIVLYAISIRS